MTNLATERSPLLHFLQNLPNEDPNFGETVQVLKVSRGERIASTQELATHMYMLMQGRAQLVCTNPEGRRLVLSTLEPGDIFGEGALINPGEYHGFTTFAEAVEECHVWCVRAATARDITTRHPILVWGLLQTYGRRLAQVESSLEDVAYKKLPERLAALLLDLANYERTTIHGFSHQNLADRLGTYRETVSAILRKFKAKGLVELGYRRIHLLDIEGLEEVAEGWGT